MTGLDQHARIVIVGCNGAGKTWFAQRMSSKTGLLVISKDALALTTGWVQRPKDVIAAAVLDATRSSAWILEGGPSILSDGVLDRATCVIWLDIPATLRFRRIVWRSMRYFGQVRPEHPPGNRDWPGLRQTTFALRALSGAGRQSSLIAERLALSKGQIQRLDNPKAVSRFLKQFD